MEKVISSSEKRLSVPIYPDVDVSNNEEKIAEENNLLSGDLERLNGKVPTVRSIRVLQEGGKFSAPASEGDGASGQRWPSAPVD